MVRQTVSNPKSSKSVLYDHLNIKTLAKGLLVSYIVTIPCFAVFSLILTNTSFPEKHITAAVVITTIISIIVAGSTTTRNIRNRGWLNGAIVGFIYMLILYIAGSLAIRNFSIDTNVLSMTAIGILSGAIGGIIGVNFRSSKRITRHKP